MLEDSIPAIWASMNSWLTPTVLFIFLNLMIGTIAVASGIGNPKQQQQNHDYPQQQQQNHDDPQQQQNPQPIRSPSVLQRLKSINLYRHEPDQTHHPQLVQAPSVLQRLKSINLYRHEPEQTHHQQHPQLVQAPSVLQRLKSINLFRFKPEDLNPFPTTTSATTITQPPPPEPETHYTQFHESETSHHHFKDETHESEEEEFFGEESLDEVFHRHIARSTSDTKPSSGIMPKKLPAKMKKSASSKSAFAHFEEEQIVEPTRPSAVRERKKTDSDVQPFGDDEEVDAKADDFINKFKQELKLQRLNSIIRYKEMLNRG